MSRHALIAGTDAAAFGMWDRKYCDDQYRATGLFNHHATLKARARDGEVFFIHTGGDGSNCVLVLIDEDLPAQEAEVYARHSGSWGLEIESGHLVVGGLEDFARTARGVTDAADDLALTPGHYEIALLLPRKSPDDEDAQEQAVLISLLSPREQRIHAWHHRACAPGCLGVVAVVVLAVMRHWKAVAILVAALLAYLFLQDLLFRRLGIDAITRKITVDPLKRPQFVLVLKRSATRIPGGHVDWDSSQLLPT